MVSFVGAYLVKPLWLAFFAYPTLVVIAFVIRFLHITVVDSDGGMQVKLKIMRPHGVFKWWFANPAKDIRTPSAQVTTPRGSFGCVQSSTLAYTPSHGAYYVITNA